MQGNILAYGLLLVAIIAETFATSSLNASKQFTRFWPSAFSVLGYVVSFYTLSHALKYIPVGIAYAIWCGLGIILVAITGVAYFKQHLDLAACLGIGLILLGAGVINVFSSSARHFQDDIGNQNPDAAHNRIYAAPEQKPHVAAMGQHGDINKYQHHAGYQQAEQAIMFYGKRHEKCQKPHNQSQLQGQMDVAKNKIGDKSARDSAKYALEKAFHSKGIVQRGDKNNGKTDPGRIGI